MQIKYSKNLSAQKINLSTQNTLLWLSHIKKIYDVSKLANQIVCLALATCKVFFCVMAVNAIIYI